MWRAISPAVLLALFVVTPCFSENDRDQIEPDRWYELKARAGPQLKTYFPDNLSGTDEDCPSDSSSTTYGWSYVSLKSDGNRELVARIRNSCVCSPTGNCDFRVFRRSGNKCVLLLESNGSVQTFQILSTASHRLHDFETSMHGSAYDSEITRGKFNPSPRLELNGCVIMTLYERIARFVQAERVCPAFPDSIQHSFLYRDYFDHSCFCRVDRGGSAARSRANK